MTVVVFLGPSLPLNEARRILPAATFLPPARQGDMASWLAEPPAAIGLIDGEFHQSRSVWHKEILLVLDRGVHVFGSSSMGALRAAELEQFGMAGVGQVFDQFASGELIDDDEVALVYHQDDGDYVHLSEPMVNVRATLAAAELAGVISAPVRDLAEKHAKDLPYPHRSRPAVLRRLQGEDVPQDQLAGLADFWRDSAVDVKADDARLLLSLLCSFAAAPPPPRLPTFELARSSSLDALYDRERRVPVSGHGIALDTIAEFVQVHHPNAAALNEAVLDRALAATLDQLLHIEPTPAEVDLEITRWRIRHHQTGDADFAAWLSRNHQSAEEFRLLARDAAGRRALRRWLVYSRHVERTTRLTLDHLRWNDEYERWSRAAAGHNAEPDADDLAPLTDDEITKLVGEHAWWGGQPVDTELGNLAEEAGFNSGLHLLSALVVAKRLRGRLLASLLAAVAAEHSTPTPAPRKDPAT
ncbi:TfuA-like protein [Micromonospora profundi]|uniref:TfuA-like protein n=1 Tax=Micromonospora TaxID=1873 RepID=UPI0033A727A8